MSKIDAGLLLEMHRRMVRIRQFELAASDLFKRGQVKGTVHPYIGQEASGVGVCMALRGDDLAARTRAAIGGFIKYLSTCQRGGKGGRTDNRKPANRITG